MRDHMHPVQETITASEDHSEFRRGIQSCVDLVPEEPFGSASVTDEASVAQPDGNNQPSTEDAP